MKQIALLALGLLATLESGTNLQIRFYQVKRRKTVIYQNNSRRQILEEKGYGYDRQPSPEGKSTAPFFFSVTVPDGNYHVTAVIGNKRAAGETTVRGESRRLFFENVKTKKGELKSCTFMIKAQLYISKKKMCASNRVNAKN